MNTTPLLWPRYIEKQFNQRVLAYFREAELVLEDGRRFIIECFETLQFLVFNENLLTFVENIATFPYLKELIALGTVMCQKAGHPIAAKLKGAKNSTRWFVSAASWSYQTVGPQMLTEIAATYKHCQVGTPTTPGALGQSLLRKVWKEEYGEEWTRHRHKVPPMIACEEMHEHRTGARSETLDQEHMHPEAWELDQKNAYGDAIGQVPTGNCYRVLRGAVAGLVTYFVQAFVTIVKPLVLGCFPVRKEGADVCYPREEGSYETWLWKEEIEECERVGCTVKKGKGWGWKEWTQEPRKWVDLMGMLRDTAPSEPTAHHLKHALVAGIGRFAMPELSYELVPGPQRGPGDVPVSAPGVVYDWWIHANIDYNPATLPHWLYYALMRCRKALYEFALPFAEQEMLLGTNTDAVIVKPCPQVENYVEKIQGAGKTGEWRRTKLYDVRLPEKRHLYSRHKITTPGVPEKKRKKYESYSPS